MANATPESLALMAHDEALHLYVMHAGSDYDIFGTWYENVQHACLSAQIDAHTVLSFPLYNWYYGNALHMILCFMLFPSALTNMAYVDNLRPAPFMSEKQYNNAIYVMFHMIAKGEVHLSMQDYYQMAPIQLFRFMYASITKYFKDPTGEHRFPAYIQNLSGRITFLLSKGDQMRSTQNAYVRRFLAHKRQAKREAHAIKVIENRFLEHVLNPYTSVGMRLLSRRATRFYQVAASSSLQCPLTT